MSKYGVFFWSVFFCIRNEYRDIGSTYQDDGLAIFKNVIGPKAEKIQKVIQKLFKDNHLNITIQCNLKIGNYLDVTFNLSNAMYRPFCKPNNEIAHIHKGSNHPPSILRQIPLSIESRLSKHSSNKKIINPPKDNIARTCNFIRKHQCPLNEKCLTNNVLYQASITTTEENPKTKIYYGVCETAFKLRYANHKKTFNNIEYQTDTDLSNEYWNIILANQISNISWKILGTHKSYNQSSKQCVLCLTEKLAIALHKDDNILNKRSEIISKCRHRNKYMLASYDNKD